MKKLNFLWLLVILAITLAAFAACDTGNNPSVEEYSVTFVDGENVLRTDTVKKGEKAISWTPSKDGYDFVGWFGEPTLTHEFDFNAPITAKTTIFAGFSAASIADIREYAIVGSGTSPILRTSDWGKVIADEHKMAKNPDRNEYVITLDLNAGDQFQFAINTSWHNQRGYGYLTETALADETLVFSGTGTIGENSAKRSNIKCELSGNYTFTLITHPADDTYETSHASYTEANKEAFNVNPYDTISWVRNGDVADEVVVITDYFIKGASITEWKDVYNATTKMVEENGVHTLSVYLKKGDEFMFTSQNTIGEQISTGTEYLRSTNLDEESKAFVNETASKNMIAVASGTYTFTYNAESKVLSVAFDASITPAAADYYIDGTFAEGVADWNGYCFNSQFKLVETEEGSGVYELNDVALKEGAQIIIQAFKQGATERGEWGTESYTGLGSYNYTYLVGGGEAFSAVGGDNNNIMILAGGNYNISFNSYSKIMTIKPAEDLGYDIYVKGGMNSWEHAFSDEYKLVKSADGKTYELTLAFEVDWELGLARYDFGSNEGYGDWIGLANLGNLGDSNDAFKQDGASNLKCKTAGSYKIVYTVETNTIDFYAVG